MARILLLSDLHLEFADYTPVKEGYDVVVLAGDIHTKDRGVAWAREHFDVPVVYVRGNHEGYGTHWENNLAKMRERAEGSNVRVLEKQSVVLEGVRFLGATGWTTFSAWHDPREAMWAAGAGRDPYSSGMRDYRHIRTGGYRRLLPRDTAAWAAQTKAWLATELAKPFDGPTVVVTHHPPTTKSLRAGQVQEPLDAADANDWDDFVVESGAACWFHGHTHHPVNYTLGQTVLGSNPRGYPGQDLDHRPNGIWVIERAPAAAPPSPGPRP